MFNFNYKSKNGYFSPKLDFLSPVSFFSEQSLHVPLHQDYKLFRPQLHLTCPKGCPRKKINTLHMIQRLLNFKNFS